jgi:hypothetical protein
VLEDVGTQPGSTHERAQDVPARIALGDRARLAQPAPRLGTPPIVNSYLTSAASSRPRATSFCGCSSA